MKYELERMGGERAKKILQSLLNELSGIEEEDMTTFELNLLRKCATNPPKRYEPWHWRIARMINNLAIARRKVGRRYD